MVLLHSDPFLTLQHHPDLTYVRLVRSEREFGSVHRVASSLRACAKALRGIEVARLGLLLDWRLAPLTTEPVLHKHVVKQTDLFAAGFARRALLMATPVGLMQSDRLGRTINPAKLVLFSDEIAAIAYAAKGESPENG